MEEIAGLLNKLSFDDVEKLKILFSINAGNTTSVITLRVFVDEYLDLIKKTRSESYYKSVKLALKHLTNYFGMQRPIGSITFKDAELFILEIQKNAPSGYRVYYRTLKAAFNKALDWNYISENHFLKVKLPKKKQLHPDFISETELRSILDVIDNDVVCDATVIGFFTGMRLNELMNLKWESVDLEKGLIIIGDSEFTTKGKNQRYVPICDEVMGVIRRRKKLDVRCEKSLSSSKVCKVEKIDSGISKNENQNDNKKDGYVFCKANGFPYTGDYVSKKFKKACNDAGIRESIHFHSLRHSFASNLVQRGVPLYVIKELLGHSSISVTEIYSHLTLDSLRDAVALLDARPIDTRPLDIRQKIEGRVESLSSSKVCKVGKIDPGISKSENIPTDASRNDRCNSSELRLIVNGDCNEL